MEFFQRMAAAMLRSQKTAVLNYAHQLIDEQGGKLIDALAAKLEGKQAAYMTAPLDLESKSDEELWSMIEPQTIDGVEVSQSLGGLLLPVISALIERWLRNRILPKK